MPLRLLKKLGGKILPGQSAAPEASKPGPKRSTRKRSSNRRTRDRDPGAAKKAARQPWTIEQFHVPPQEGKTRFHDLGLPPMIMHAIADLDFRYCTPVQAEVLRKENRRRNVAGQAQTGTGKTAAFLISILSDFLQRPPGRDRPAGTPRALILGPTRELVMQIVKDAHDLGRYCPIHSVAVYGGMDYERQQRSLAGPVDLIGATPGRLLDFKNKGVVNLGAVEFLVIDEADRMLDMGFIPDVRRIIRSLPRKDRRHSLLFSATLNEDVLRLASQWMPDPVLIKIEPESVAVDTVEQVVYTVTARQKFSLLYNLLTGKHMHRVLVFGNRRDRTQRLADELSQRGVKCELLTGAIQQKKRLKILEAFRNGDIDVLVATDVAGRGLHVDDITHVINYELPYEPQDYVHRIGRTGRAGSLGTSISFACEDESFIIPEIEELLGHSLSCRHPEDSLLKPPPRRKSPRPERSLAKERPPRRRRRY